MMLYGDTFMYVIFLVYFLSLSFLLSLSLPLRKHNVENQILNLYPKHQRKASKKRSEKK